MGGKINYGEYLLRFEEEFKRFIGSKYAICVPSGKMGLYLSLKAMGAKEGDEMIIPAYTVWDVPAIIVALGMKPVFVDIGKDSYNLDVNLIKNAVTDKTKFILATHLYGIPCDMDAILKVAEEFNLRIIEDCAQGLGAEYKNKKVGAIAEIGYFSFGLLKNLNTLGGGMVVTDNPSLADAVRKELMLFVYPQKSNLMKNLFLAYLLSLVTNPIFFSIFLFPLIYFFGDYVNEITADILGSRPPAHIIPDFLTKFKLKFTNLQAAIGCSQLKKIETLNALRIKNAAILNGLLKDIDKIKITQIPPHTYPIYLNYVISVPEANRAEIIKKLRKKGIDIGYGFLNNCADMQEFADFKKDCPMSRQLVKTNLYLPLQPPLSEKHMQRIAENLKLIPRNL